MMMRPRGLWRPIASGVTGGVIGGLFVFAGIPLAFAALGGVAAFFGANLLFGRERSLVLDLARQPPPETLDQCLARIREQAARMREQGQQLQHAGIATRVDLIRSLLEDIGDDLVLHPEDLRAARRFLDYYPGTTLKIVDRYIELSRHQARTDELERSLAKVESVLKVVEVAFRKELAHLLEDDLLDLDSEMDVLERSMQMEGFGGFNESK